MSDTEPDELPLDPEPGKKVRGKRGPRTGPRRGSLEAPLRAMLETVGGVWATTEGIKYPEDKPNCGDILLLQAPDIAANLNMLASTNASVHAWLSKMMTGGGWGGVILACWPVAVQVQRHHIAPAAARRAEKRAQSVAESEDAVQAALDRMNVG